VLQLPQLPGCSKEGADGLATQPTFVVEQIRRMRGGAQSHLMRSKADDYYIVKFQGNPQGTRILVNELLGTLLAACLGLPTAPTAICYVSEELIRLTPDLCVEIARGRTPCRPGLHFGSRYVRDPRNVSLLDFLPNDELASVKNVADFRGMLVFDKWTCNCDGRQTLFCQSDLNTPFEAVMIDQGFCFNGGEWNFPDTPLRGLHRQYIVYEHVRGMGDFEPWITRLEQINEGVLMQLAESIPREWYDFDSDSYQRLLERLDRRRSRVRELLWDTWKARPYTFPKWTEGISHVA
jgi:HipA-like protein